MFTEKLRPLAIQALLVALTLGAPLHARAQTAAAPKVLRLGIALSSESVEWRAMQFLAQRVAALSQGRLALDLHAGGALGDDVSMVKALQAGSQDMAGPDGSTLASLVKDFSVINYPFTFLDEVEADAVLDGAWGQQVLEKLTPQGVIGLTYFENGFRQITNSRRPLESPADFSGIRLRTMQNPMLIDSFARLGFDAVPMAFPKVYEALRTQAVDGQENPLPTILSSRFYEVQKYLTLSRHVYSVHVVLVSRKTWDGLRPDDQQNLRRAALEARDFQRRLNRQENANALTALKAKGMVVSTISRSEAERIRNRLRNVLDHYNAEVGTASVLQMYIELGRLRTQEAPPRGSPTGSMEARR